MPAFRPRRMSQTWIFSRRCAASWSACARCHVAHARSSATDAALPRPVQPASCSTTAGIASGRSAASRPRHGRPLPRLPRALRRPRRSRLRVRRPRARSMSNQSVVGAGGERRASRAPDRSRVVPEAVKPCRRAASPCAGLAAEVSVGGSFVRDRPQFPPGWTPSMRSTRRGRGGRSVKAACCAALPRTSAVRCLPAPPPARFPHGRAR